MKKIIIFILFLLSPLLNATPLDYLNTLRTSTGLNPFSNNTQLHNSAQNHSNYMQQNNTAGHGEVSGNSGFTGETPSVRTQYTGYSSLFIGENVSAGTSTIEASIDGLFSAIYHRFGFLSFHYDMIGIGSNSTFYTYDFSNSQHNLLCEGASYTGAESYYTNACIDSNKHISVTDYTNASNSFKANATALILWPALNVNNIPPVFYEESPDPLPSHGVTGYPISVEFNDKKFDTPPVVTQFTLKDESNTTLNLLTTMKNNNDPANKFTAYQTAIFPEERLEWGSIYYPSMHYDFNGTSTTKKWCFSTKSLILEAAHFYRVQNNTDINYTVRSGESYAIYVVPKDTNDKINSVSYSYNVSNVSFAYIDNNTVNITLNGSIGSYAIFTFNNGQKITLTIQNSDTSTIPKNESCPLTDPKIYAVSTQLSTSNIVNSPTPIDIVLSISKPNNIPTTQTLIISLPKNNNMALNFDTSLQTLQGHNLSNNAWSHSQTQGQHTFTYIDNDGILPNNTTINLGLTSLFSPPLDKRGSFTFNAQTSFKLENTEGENNIITYSNLPN
jgi:hypothetical protein